MPICGCRFSGRLTCESRSSTFCRFQSLADSSSKISITLESPNSEVRAQMVQVRNAVHHDFDGDGDLLLHLLGRAARAIA